MEYLTGTTPLAADYYRRHAARVGQLASDATTLAVRDHLRSVALEYERLAERVDAASLIQRTERRAEA